MTQVSRRSLLKFSSVVVPSLFVFQKASLVYANGLQSASIGDTTPISEKLLYSTVRLSEKINDADSSIGTGFFFQLLKGTHSSVPVIVTNKHVVEKMWSCSFSIHRAGDHGTVDKTDVVDIFLPDIQNRLIAHPSEDLVIIPIADVIKQHVDQKNAFYISWLHRDLIPTDAVLESLKPLEEILTVGFPGNFYDTLHNIPLFHSGHTSTPVNMPFATDYDEGRRHSKKTFLVDLATLPGSSGSPVFIFNENGYSDRNGNHMLGNTRLLLIGVVFGVATQEVRGKVKIQSIPNETGEEYLSIPINVGACLLADQILEFEELLLGRGFVPPEGYQKRT